MDVYRISRWKDYEPHDAKKVKKLNWFKASVDPHKRWKQLAARALGTDTTIVHGVWAILKEFAALGRENERGYLCVDGFVMTPKELATQTGCKQQHIELGIHFFSHPDIGMLEQVNVTFARLPHDAASLLKGFSSKNFDDPQETPRESKASINQENFLEPQDPTEISRDFEKVSETSPLEGRIEKEGKGKEQEGSIEKEEKEKKKHLKAAPAKAIKPPEELVLLESASAYVDTVPPPKLPVSDAQRIFDAYPRKEYKENALTAIKNALKKKPPEFLLEKVQAYAAILRKRQISAKSPQWRYVPSAATWFKDERYELTQAEWVGNFRKQPSSSYQNEHVRASDRLNEPPPNWKETLEKLFPKNSYVDFYKDWNGEWRSLSQELKEDVLRGKRLF